MDKPTLYRMPNEEVIDGDQVVNTAFFTRENFDKVRDLSMEQGDLLIATYPKSGTTWMQELAYLVFNGADVDLAKQKPIFVRSWFLEMSAKEIGVGVERVQDEPHPWVMKSHLPVRFFSKQLAENKAKVIVVMRNPKDTLVSFYHFYNNLDILGPFPGTWDEFFELVKAKHTMNGDVFDWNASWWAQRDNKNIMYVKYEDMKRDIRGVIRQVALHCGKDLSAEDVEKIAEHTSFQTLQTNPMVNISLLPGLPGNVKITSFLRKGEIGDWKNYFTPEQSAYIDNLYRIKYEAEGLHFDFE